MNFKNLVESTLNEAVRVDTIRYERSWGKKPKGGTGSWMFTDARTGAGDTFIAPRGNYTSAKKAAVQWAKEKGYDVIYAME